MGQFNREKVPFPLRRDTFEKTLAAAIESAEKKLDKLRDKDVPDAKEQIFMLTSNIEAYKNVQNLPLKTEKDLANAQWLFNDGRLRSDEEINDVNEQQRISEIVTGRYYKALHHPALWFFVTLLTLLLLPGFAIKLMDTAMALMERASGGYASHRLSIPYISEGIFMGIYDSGIYMDISKVILRILHFPILKVIFHNYIPLYKLSQFALPLALAFLHKKILDRVFLVKENPDIKEWKAYKKFSNPVRLILKWLVICAFYSALIQGIVEYGFLKTLIEGFVFGYVALIGGAVVAIAHELRCAKWFNVPVNSAIAAACLAGAVVGAVGMGMSERDARKVRRSTRIDDPDYC